MLENIKFVKHNSIKIGGSKTIYIDPFKIDRSYNDADYIFCTHSHYDHFSPEDIKKVITDKTTIITVASSREEAEKLSKNVIIVEPDNSYEIDTIKFHTTYSYNLNKPFHPKNNGWVGFIIQLDGISYYIAGDTDNIPEIQKIECDVAFIPIGGTYTMDYKEAAELANLMDCRIVIPTHYGTIVGNIEDGIKFSKLVKNKEIKIDRKSVV